MPIPIYPRKVQQTNKAVGTVLKTVVLTLAGAQTVGAKPTLAFVMPENGVFQTAKARLGTVNTGATFIIDVNKNGTTLYTTQTRRPTIAISANPAVSTETAQADVTSLPKGSVVTVDVDQVGSTVAGSDLSVTISYLARDFS